ncbi:hypothetical protein [Vibrio tasmaniensis]|uniref:hypothetical protein n=1 Tax=Vibrio tasmaniensis TaxID=212663 RepID=UPI001112F057|nr:hypothetical protein [Vibrio tasmaniensis]
MFAVLYCTVLLVAVMVPSAIAHTDSYTFQVSTNIDRSNMLADTVSLKLDPSSITLAYDPSISTFADKQVKLNIESDVYLFDSKLKITGYQLFLINNVSSCYSSVRPELDNMLDGYDSIAKIHIDDKVAPMNIDEAITYSDINFDSTSNVVTHGLKLKFKVISDEEVRSCNGSFVVGFRYDL